MGWLIKDSPSEFGGLPGKTGIKADVSEDDELDADVEVSVFTEDGLEDPRGRGVGRGLGSVVRPVGAKTLTGLNQPTLAWPAPRPAAPGVLERRPGEGGVGNW